MLTWVINRGQRVAIYLRLLPSILPSSLTFPPAVFGINRLAGSFARPFPKRTRHTDERAYVAETTVESIQLWETSDTLLGKWNPDQSILPKIFARKPRRNGEMQKGKKKRNSTTRRNPFSSVASQPIVSKRCMEMLVPAGNTNGNFIF